MDYSVSSDLRKVLDPSERCTALALWLLSRSEREWLEVERYE